MKRTMLILACVLAIYSVGCSPEKYKPGSAGDPSIPAEKKVAPADIVSDVPKGVDVGDVESTVFIEASVDEATKPPNMKLESIKGMKNHVGLVTVTIPEPFPPQLQLVFNVVSEKAFPETPFVVRAKVFRDQDVVGEFSTLVLADTAQSLAPPKPFQYRINILEGLSATPDTILVHAQAEVAVLAKGTDPATVDVKTVQNASGPNGTLLSNPIRINFEQNSVAPQS